MATDKRISSSPHKQGTILPQAWKVTSTEDAVANLARRSRALTGGTQRDVPADLRVGHTNSRPFALPYTLRFTASRWNRVRKRHRLAVGALGKKTGIKSAYDEVINIMDEADNYKEESLYDDASGLRTRASTQIFKVYYYVLALSAALQSISRISTV